LFWHFIESRIKTGVLGSHGTLPTKLSTDFVDSKKTALETGA
jgi:hypothetical protein